MRKISVNSVVIPSGRRRSIAAAAVTRSLLRFSPPREAEPAELMTAAKQATLDYLWGGGCGAGRSSGRLLLGKVR